MTINIMKKTKNIKHKKHRKTRKRRGGNVKANQMVKDNFRNMFMNSFSKMQTAMKTNNEPQLQKAITTLINGLKSNQLGINTLIPVTTNYIPISKQTYSSSTTPIIAFVPSLAILFHHIPNFELQKIFIQQFIQNKGNINLKSYTKNITPLSSAIDLKQMTLINYLLQQGADINVLTDEQRNELNMILTPSTKQQLPSEKKLDLSIILNPLDYDYNNEPTFWRKLFSEGKMIEIRNNLQNMIMNDANILSISGGEMQEMWSVCKINKTIIPSYYVPSKNEPYMSFGNLIYDQNMDFSYYNILLCATLLVYGIISDKMSGEDYDLIFKGGKATQLVLSGIENIDEYKTEDIDVLVMQKPSIPYNSQNIQNLSGHVAHFVKWFLQIPNSPFNISVLEPNPENKRANPYIYKLSYIKQTKKRDYKRQIMVDDFKPFSDIDFKETPENIKPFFDASTEYVFSIPELKTKVLFKCPNLGSLLDEKLHYYAKYKKIIQDNKPINEEGLTIEECERLLEKFKRSILAMNRGLQKQRFGELSPEELRNKETKSIQNRLEKIGIVDETLKVSIINDFL
jgi:hypothetical protein